VSFIKDVLITHTNAYVSFDKEALNITIHNLHSGLELTSPVYYSIGMACYVSPSQKIDADDTMEASFGIDSKQDDFKGALLYKLQRKHATKTNQSNSSTASIKDIATGVYLWVVWNVNDQHNRFYVHLIECVDDFAWDEDRLWTLYKQYNYILYKYRDTNIITWLMNDGAVMRTKRDVIYGSDYKLNIVLSEGTGKYDMEKPMQIDQEMSVLPL
jgi:hypothetical protein